MGPFGDTPGVRPRQTVKGRDGVGQIARRQPALAPDRFRRARTGPRAPRLAGFGAVAGAQEGEEVATPALVRAVRPCLHCRFPLWR